LVEVLPLPIPGVSLRLFFRPTSLACLIDLVHAASVVF
jgi:hypothetical protein